MIPTVTVTVSTFLLSFLSSPPGVASAGFSRLEAGPHVKTLAEECKLEKFRVGPKTKFILETSNFGVKYSDNLSCSNIFSADGSCSLLMQCSDFNLQPRTGKGKCADFLSVKLRKQRVKKYCGAERTVLNSVNLGSWAKISVKTNGGDSNYTGLKCTVTCCPSNLLTQTEVSLDFRSRNGEILQSCSASNSHSGENTCGVKGPVTKIVGGVTAEKYKYTWLALLVRRTDTKVATRLTSDAIPSGMEPFCGATLVSQYWVITASHCTLGGHPDQYRVVLGEWDRTVLTDTVVRVHKISSMHKHPQYNSVTYNNDIAMWRLASQADLQHFRTICLPRPGMKISNPLRVAGWGVTTEGSSAMSTILKEVAVPVVSAAQCEKAMSPYTITANMLCAGGIRGQDACQGDSGGPLMGEEPGSEQVFLAGVVSWGLGCAHEGLFGVYTKVSKYQGWIEKHINS